MGELARNAIGEEAFDKVVEVDRYTQRFGNILTKGTLHLAPQSAQVAGLLTLTITVIPTLTLTLTPALILALALLRTVPPRVGECPAPPP